MNNGSAVGPQGEGSDSPSRFSTYPAYKDSGVEWLEQVPDHWCSVPIKYMALERNSLFLDGDWIESKDISSDGIRYITTGNVGEGAYKEQGAGFISEETFHALGCTEVYEGDVLVSRLNNPIGRACVVPDLGGRVVTSVDNVIFRPDSKFDKKFIVYLFSSEEYFKHTSNLARGATMQRISRGLLGNIRVVTPSLEEQTQIARFLDHETARIDALIEEQQRLIELLKEKRQAVISHAVTKGLDPTVPMKDSGVEWLGEVPAHWVVGRAKLVSDIFVPQRNKPELNDSEGIPWVTMEDMNGGYISATNLKVTEPAAREAGSKVLKKGAVIASCVGRFGIVAINAVDVVINQQLQAFEPRKIKAEYLRSIVSLSKEYFELIGTAATLVYVNQQGFENLPVLVPSADEQESICLYVDEANARFDALLSQSFESIQLLQERRSALISAAVTGKIDVRGWQPPASTQAPELAVAEAV
ncbi:restriction endonuclease subunit S [Pseudomonas sp. GOM6]|uniref:restriction endonuclease subunit S n=1 Tax=Pseudomonas sp. GOM6 TaxID=3036944 RepID=UPI00240A3E2D|nr:restriction endonuclease subunit S [Pseudomonas sp. GOM6]MDG1581274.1 restriction endonuclease subunit S [Pseudomonas sp. GOM6]